MEMLYGAPQPIAPDPGRELLGEAGRDRAAAQADQAMAAQVTQGSDPASAIT